MFVKEVREKEISRVKNGSKRALFSKDLMFGKKTREKEAAFAKKQTDRKCQRSTNAKDKKPLKMLAQTFKDRFVQDRQQGKIEAEKDGYIASRYVQPATTKNAGKLASWSASNPFSVEPAYTSQNFPLWDEETVKTLKANQHLNVQNHDEAQHLPSIKANDARTETTSWALQDYGLANKLTVGAASAVLLAMKDNLSVCCLGEGCYERNVEHLRSVRHLHLEQKSQRIVHVEMLSKKYALVRQDGFLAHNHYQPHDVSKSLTSTEFRASVSPMSPLRRPLGPLGCEWTRIKINPIGEYEGYVQIESGLVPHGRGTMVWKDGNVYRGEWQNGQMHGELGEYWSAVDESLYRGNWYKGKRQGQGEYWLDGENRDGERYKGGFLDGEFSGYGEYRLKSGNILYRGEWEHDKWCGRGIVYWRNGSIKYDGFWENGIKNGIGTWYRSNGALAYRGEMKDGKFHGHGKYYSPRGRKNSGWAEGEWVCGELTGNNCEATFYIGDTTFVHYIGNIDRGRICGYGKTQYPDKRVCHGIAERVRLPLVRSLAEDLRKDREDNSKWANEGQCWVGGETNDGETYEDLLLKKRRLIMIAAQKKIKRGLTLSQEEKDITADFQYDEEGDTLGGDSNMATCTGTGNMHREKLVKLCCVGTIVFLDDSRYDGISINGVAHGKHGVKIGPQGRCTYGTFENGRCITKRNAVEGIAWRLVVYKSKTIIKSKVGEKLLGYRNGSRLSDNYLPMSATGALWLWFTKQDFGIFGGDKIRDRFGPTMRSAQLEMIFEIVKRNRQLCGTVRISTKKGITILERGCQPLLLRKEFTRVFEFARGDTVWPDAIQQTYRKLVQILRAAMEK